MTSPQVVKSATCLTVSWFVGKLSSKPRWVWCEKVHVHCSIAGLGLG